MEKSESSNKRAANVGDESPASEGRSGSGAAQSPKVFQTASGKPTNLSGLGHKQREMQQQIQEAEMIVKYTKR
jgi:hypothetical protein